MHLHVWRTWAASDVQLASCTCASAAPRRRERPDTCARRPRASSHAARARRPSPGPRRAAPGDGQPGGRGRQVLADGPGQGGRHPEAAHGRVSLGLLYSTHWPRAPAGRRPPVARARLAARLAPRASRRAPRVQRRRARRVCCVAAARRVHPAPPPPRDPAARRCECVEVGGGLYALRPDAKQLSEAELRKLVRRADASAAPPAPSFFTCGWRVGCSSVASGGRSRPL